MMSLVRKVGKLLGSGPDGLRWRFSDAGRSLLSTDDLSLRKHLAGGAATVVKHGVHRSVYRIQLDGYAVYWKHCRISGLAAYLRQWIRPAKAFLEFDRAIALAARGIPTVEPLAWAKQPFRQSGPSHLITRELAGTVSLSDYLAENSVGQSRREVAATLGQYVAKLHEAGVVHPDLHPGNILVRQDGSGAPQFFLLDIHNIGLGRALSVAASQANLVLLNRWFSARTTRTDRLRFWNAYRQARSWKNQSGREIERKTGESNRILWIDRADRYWRTNKNFRLVSTRLTRGHAVRELIQAEIDRLMADPDEPFRSPSKTLLKDSATSTVAEVDIDTTSGRVPMIFKRFRLKKRGATIANLFRRSAALRSWQMGHSLLDRGLKTPRPYLVIHRRGRLGDREGYLLCEKIEGASDLLDAVKVMARRQKRNAIDRLGRTLRRMHEAGVSHRDLKATNLLVTFDSEQLAEFHFIDLVGVRLLSSVPASLRVRNLSRLVVSFLKHPSVTRTDLVRFLRSYMCWGLKGQAGWKEWWKKLAEASRAKVEKNRRSGRALT